MVEHFNYINRTVNRFTTSKGLQTLKALKFFSYQNHQ